MQSVLIIQCFICNVSVLLAASYGSTARRGGVPDSGDGEGSGGTRWQRTIVSGTHDRPYYVVLICKVSVDCLTVK